MRRLTTAIAAAIALCLALGVPSAFAEAPLIVKTTFSHLTTESARVEALIDPKGANTKYRFEYGTSPCSSSTCTRVPVPEGKVPVTVKATGDLKENDDTITNVSLGEGAFAVGDAISGAGIPSGATVTAVDTATETLVISKAATATATGVALTATGPQPVSAPIGGLSSNTVYHLRVIANNGTKAEGPEVTFHTYRPPQVFPSCPNEALRANQPSAALPDCRAYEQASPVDKNGVDALDRVAFARTSADGKRVIFVSTSSVPGGVGAQEMPAYLASRGTGDWSTQGILPPESEGTEVRMRGWTPDLASVFESVNKPLAGGGFDSTLLSRSSADRSLTPLVPYGDNLGKAAISLAGTSAEASEVFFESPSKLSQAPAGLQGHSNVYVWDRATNTLHLASALNSASPEGEAPPKGAFAGPYDWIGEGPLKGGVAQGYYTQDDHAITASGDLYFTAAKTGQLYLRRNPTKAQSPLDGNGKCTKPELACTVQVSASQKTNGGLKGADAAGSQPAAFMGATPDGSKVLLASSEKLTNDATTGPEPGPPAIANAKLGASEAEEINTALIPAAKATGLVSEGAFLYWANPTSGSIGRAEISGGGVTDVKEEFIGELGAPRWLAADSKYLYWSDLHEGNEEEGTIGRVELDGANPEAEFITGLGRPQGVAVDAGHIYWANEGAGRSDKPAAIGRAGIEGDAVEAEWHKLTANELPRGIAVDGGHVYWTLNQPVGTGETIALFLYRAELNGSNQVFKFLNQGPNFKIGGIAIDGSHLYWADQTGNEIGRADLNLENLEAEFIDPAETGDSPVGLALGGSHLYWSLNGDALPNAGNDLYRYEPASGTLKDLTVDKADPNGAEVKGVLGTSKDGSDVYFAANGVPDGVVGSPNANGEEAEAGNCRGEATFGFAFSGSCNLYLVAEGQPTRFISRLEAESDAHDWQPQGRLSSSVGRTARVTPDGQTLLFLSKRQLTSYDNEAVPELYLYHAGGAGFACVSCDPSGEAPVRVPPKGSSIAPEEGPGFGRVDLTGPVAPSTPAPVLSRNLSTDGKRVFFETTDGLVPEDTNGEEGCPRVGTESFADFPACLDVYEWEAQGTGSCQEDEQGGGCLYLLSTGKSETPAFIADASESGDDVFLLTRSAGLVRQDQDQLFDVYDARVQGGLVAQNQLPAPICENEGCKPGPTPPPSFESPQTPRFSGSGNVKEKPGKCKKAKGKKKGCKAKKHHKQGHKRGATKKGRASR
jgi:hypothetical protein